MSAKQEWLYKTEKKQNETKPSENPVLLVKDIVQKTGKLDRELMYLLNKAKYYVPKTKPTGNNTRQNPSESNFSCTVTAHASDNRYPFLYTWYATFHAWIHSFWMVALGEELHLDKKCFSLICR